MISGRAAIEALVPCDQCTLLTRIELLDSKPEMTLWLHIIRLLRGQRYMLGYAANHGYDFSVLECHTCYGSGWSPT